jgi:hypothetical protein
MPHPTNHPQKPQKSPHGYTQPQQPPSLIQCNGCNNTWTGVSACHCSGCHPPPTRRLVPIERLYWTGWALPGENPIGDLT